MCGAAWLRQPRRGWRSLAAPQGIFFPGVGFMTPIPFNKLPCYRRFLVKVAPVQVFVFKRIVLHLWCHNIFG